MPVFQLTDALIFPPPHLAREDGLLAVGGDLSEPRLLLAYQMGIFPWYSPGEPILWWAPDPRLVIIPEEFKIPKRLARKIKQNMFHVTMDQAFSQVIETCAQIPRKQGKGTWIDKDMIEAYTKLHTLGYAHSVECWQENKLVGGLYGVSLGTTFFGESMFSHATDSSKVALAYLIEHLIEWNFEMIDCQITTEHLMKLGAKQLPASEFYELLEKSVTQPTRQGPWHFS